MGIWLLLFTLGVSTTGGAAALTGQETLVRAYDAILDADFAGASRQLAACADAPPAACQVLDAIRVWWQIQLNPYDRSRDAEFSRLVNRAIASSEAWVVDEPDRAEAWFYLGGAYGARVQWRVLRTERLAAARDGKRIKEALEHALDLDPHLEDANFGIGLYEYYADVAPTIARIFRWLLLLPGGDRADGLARMIRARDKGQLVGPEAGYQLHVIYLWYEKNFEKALEIVEDLELRYPRNPLFLQLVGSIRDIYFHDPTSSARAYERLLARVRSGRVNELRLAETTARLGLADQLDTIFESDRALEQARAVIAAEPTAPHGALARAWLFAGRASLHLGDTAAARAAFAKAASVTPSDDGFDIEARITTLERTHVDPVAAQAYRIGLEGWRAYERRAYVEAEAALARAVALAPSDMIARYRYGRVLQARGNERGAREQWETVAAAGGTAPPIAFADACLALGQLIERSEPARALTLFNQATHTFGAFDETRSLARRRAEQLRSGGR